VALSGSQALNGGCSKMNDRPEAHVELFALANICREAAERHGDNWSALETHIKRCFDALPKDQRARLVNEMGRVLRYYAPDANMRTQ
jgi:hypothetical protein